MPDILDNINWHRISLIDSKISRVIFIAEESRLHHKIAIPLVLNMTNGKLNHL